MDGHDVVFRDEHSAWRGPGAPPVAIPDELAAWLERTYSEGTVCEIPCDPQSDDAALLVRLLRIYVRRQGRALSHQFFEHEGKPHIRFRMRNKRNYTRTAGLARERR